MRILAVTPYYAPEGGGLERYAHAVLSRLARRGHEVEALAFSKQGSQDTEADGVALHRRAMPLRFGNTPVDLSFSRQVEEHVRRSRAEVVLAHAPVPFPAAMACVAARRSRTPFVLTYHAGRLRGSTVVLDIVARITRATVEPRMMAQSRRLIAVSPFVRDHALARHRERVSLIPPGVDPRLFSPAPPPAGDEVLSVAPLDSAYRWKGVDVLLEAFGRVRERRPGARLTLVGAGDRLASFQRLAKRSGGWLRVTGRLTDEGLATAYRQATVVALPSLTEAESFGMVLAEANACGRPVVASRVGGIPDFVRDGENGLLAEPGDAGGLAARLLELLEDRGLAARLGAQGQARVRREHDWDRIAKQTEAVLEAASADG